MVLPIIVNVVYDHQVNKKLSEILASEHQWMGVQGLEPQVCELIEVF